MSKSLKSTLGILSTSIRSFRGTEPMHPKNCAKLGTALTKSKCARTSRCRRFYPVSSVWQKSSLPFASHRPKPLCGTPMFGFSTSRTRTDTSSHAFMPTCMRAPASAPALGWIVPAIGKNSKTARFAHRLPILSATSRRLWATIPRT